MIAKARKCSDSVTQMECAKDNRQQEQVPPWLFVPSRQREETDS